VTYLGYAWLASTLSFLIAAEPTLADSPLWSSATRLTDTKFAAQEQCPLSAKAGAGWVGSAALEELAQKRGLPESDVGAVLILRRDEACEVLEQQLNLLPETKQAIESECQQFIYLAPSSEEQYISAAEGYLHDRQPTLVSLAWALKGVDDTPPVHVVLVADGASAVRLSSPGYGRKGPSTSTCVASPWRW
jgi:hypothetical protein